MKPNHDYGMPLTTRAALGLSPRPDSLNSRRRRTRPVLYACGLGLGMAGALIILILR